MSSYFSQELWFRNKRRVSDIGGILERRKFQVLRQRFYTDLWCDAAKQVGAELEELANGLIQISRGGMTTFVDKSNIMLDSDVMVRILADKSLTYGWLSAKGLRVPKCAVFNLSSLGLAERFRAEHSAPVVVKPADGSGGGHGVTTGITDYSGLKAAARHAAAFHPRILIEEELPGASFRLLFLDGEFVDAIRRDPPHLTGDGKATIKQLANHENDRRRTARLISALSPLIIDRESRNTLARNGLTPASVPNVGERVQAKLAVNENSSAENHVVRNIVHRSVIEAGCRVVRDLAIGFAGLDVTSGDISCPLKEGDTIFNEINACPGIHHHYLVAEPELGSAVAPIILDRLFSGARGTMRL